MIKAIIFDWTEVIATDGFGDWLAKDFKDFDIGKDHLDDLVNSGEISHEEFLERISKILGTTPGEVWEGTKKETFINWELVEIIKKLKEKYKIGLLSNFTAPWLREIIDKNNLWDLFDEYIISSEHKMIKPNNEIFYKMFEMLKVKPEEAIFVDDREKNTKAGETLGLKTILFKNKEQFLQDLKNFGIEI